MAADHPFAPDAGPPAPGPIRRRPSGPMAWLILIVATSSVVRMLRVLSPAAAAHPTDGQVVDLAFGFALRAWVVGDARRLRAVPCLDFGFLVAAFFPPSIAWYALWSRGWRGVPLLADLLGLACLPRVLALITWSVVAGG